MFIDRKINGALIQDLAQKGWRGVVGGGRVVGGFKMQVWRMVEKQQTEGKELERKERISEMREKKKWWWDEPVAAARDEQPYV